MARTNYKEAELINAHGNLHQVIPSLVNELGQTKTAVKLGVSQFFVSHWLRRNGYILISRWEKEKTPSQMS